MEHSQYHICHFVVPRDNHYLSRDESAPAAPSSHPKTRLVAYRAKLLGRALLAARTDVISFWMLISGNAEVAFPSTNATTTLVANVTTSASVGASTNDNADPVAVSPVSTTAAVFAAAQKRKACP
jgi:hypothetical protein